MTETDKKSLKIGKASNLKEVFTFNRILIMIIAIGIILRVVTFWTLPPMHDGNAYIAVGHSLSNTGEVVAPWGGDLGSGNSSNLEYTRISPIYPAYLAFFYTTFGYSIEITQIAGIIFAVITLLIIYLTTKDLFGHRKGLIVTAIISVTWPLIIYPGMEWADNVVLLFFTLTLWSFLKGLKDSRYMILFGLFAAILFLTKIHSVHYIIIIAPIVGFFIWRFLYIGWDVLRDRNYYIGGAIFILITLGWQIRNYVRFAGTSQGGSFIYTSADLSIELLLMFVLKFLFLILLSALCFIFWFRELRETISKIKKEEYNILWVFTGGYFLMIWFITSLMGGVNIGDTNIVFRLNHHRYITPIYISILWLVVKDTKWSHQGRNINYFGKEIIHETRKWLMRSFRDKKTLAFIIIVALVGILALIRIEFYIGVVLIISAPTLALQSVRKKLAVMLLAFSIASVNGATFIKSPPQIEAAKDLDAILIDGDSIMVDGEEWFVPDKYSLYPYLTEHDIRVMEYDENLNGTYIITYEDRNYTGYELIGRYYWDGELGIVDKARNKVLGLFFSRYADDAPSTNERIPSAWLWKKI
jgi:4-amino-4-deoxy-L-arabinose transferase-like glycosyltransferase